MPLTLFHKRDVMAEHMLIVILLCLSQPGFRLSFSYIFMKDYRCLKTGENSRLSLNWNLNREISKLNYKIYTDAIKDNLIPSELTPAQISYTYASEADMLNDIANKWFVIIM